MSSQTNIDDIPNSEVLHYSVTPDSIPIPPVPKRKQSSMSLQKNEDEENLKLEKKRKPLFLGTDLASLYWKLAWLQFIAISIGYWTMLIKTYDLNAPSFWKGFSPDSFLDALYGTFTAFSNVVIGAIMKLYNKQIDEKQQIEDQSKHDAEKLRKEKDVFIDLNKKQEKRILDLESQILNMSMKMQKYAEDQIKKNHGVN